MVSFLPKVRRKVQPGIWVQVEEVLWKMRWGSRAET
jgi:hypothetical protein